MKTKSQEKEVEQHGDGCENLAVKSSRTAV
jgi:hypothetical protein